MSFQSGPVRDEPETLGPDAGEQFPGTFCSLHNNGKALALAMMPSGAMIIAYPHSDDPHDPERGAVRVDMTAEDLRELGDYLIGYYGTSNQAV